MRPTLVRTAMGILYFAGITAIVGWALPEKGPAGHRTAPVTRIPETRIADMTDMHSTPAPKTSKVHSKVNCAECGVIESMRTIDSREEIVGGCEIGDTAGMRIPGTPFDIGERNDLVTLADILTGEIVGGRGATRVRVTTRYQIIVRMRDGSAHVFNEDTPGTLRVGERMLVIGGATGANGWRVRLGSTSNHA